MGDSIQPAVLERPKELTELSQLTFEVIAGDYSRPGNQPANYTLVKGRREALLVDVPFGRADAHRLIARILDTGLKLHTIFITHSRERSAQDGGSDRTAPRRFAEAGGNEQSSHCQIEEDRKQKL